MLLTKQTVPSVALSALIVCTKNPLKKGYKNCLSMTSRSLLTDFYFFFKKKINKNTLSSGNQIHHHHYHHQKKQTEQIQFSGLHRTG